MEPEIIKAISQQIYRRFPEVAGSRPKVRQQISPQAKSLPAVATFLLTFQGKAETTDGKEIPRLVRVIATSQGKILKVTTSR
jgi:hypothetical protein